MTPLRRRFIEDMLMRGLAPTTQRSYIHYVAGYAKFYNKSPEVLDLEAIRQYELFLLEERKLAPTSINSFVSAVQFLYLVTLEMPWGKEHFPRIRVGHKLPVVLSPEEVSLFFHHVASLKHRAVRMLCYGAGLRISEVVSVKVGDIDSQLDVLRRYYRAARPEKEFLFPSWSQSRHLTASSVSVACRDTARCCGLTKRITARTLRHSFATHLLENDTDTRIIQALLGHSSIETTVHYTQVAAHLVARTQSPLDALTVPPKAKAKAQSKAEPKTPWQKTLVRRRKKKEQ
ncbi:MAG: site-specific integrase [Saprospiraceae bacterium]